MIKAFFISSLFLVSAIATAQDSAKAEIMFIGVFHFDNPGLDAIKTDQINVMTEENQRYLEAATDRLAGFSPTHVLLECLPESSPTYTENLLEYIDGEFELAPRESHQLGFRIAEKSGLKELHCYDDRSIEWQFEPMMAHISESEPQVLGKFNQTIEDVTVEIETLQSTKTLEELLLIFNTEEFDKKNKGIYLTTNMAGAGDGFQGADASASWWHRNFRMYANIQTVAQPGTRVIVIGGQGHTAILKDLVELDSERTAEAVSSYLRQ